MIRKYMLSELIKDAVEVLKKHGDLPLVADVLTENQSNIFDICAGLDIHKGECQITLDLNHLTVKEIKNKIN
ncbi:hypothetical protein ACDN41_12060 [Priestia aryabhattai]|uniref:hypothetical protein n=1 Tax=Priestia aryabhattai TaxID=412384 RepID=UPI0035321C72